MITYLQKNGQPLNHIRFIVYVQRLLRAVVGLEGAVGREIASDLIAADRGEADGIFDVNLVNHPAHSGMPVNGVQDAAGGGRGDDIVGAALHL